MDTPIKTIDVDRMHLSGKKNSCSEYVMYQKVRRKYIAPIQKDIDAYSVLVAKNKNFIDNKYHNKIKLLSLFDYIMDKFDHYDLKKLLSKEYTNLDFIYEACRIRYANQELTDSSV